MNGAWRRTTTRWLRFNAVGGLGIVVQLIALAVLTSGLHLNYLLATALAVEAAVIHNYLWHERFTWADRADRADRAGAGVVRFLKFNLTTGVFSIAGNMTVMKLLVNLARLNYVVANGIAIAVCSLANFVVSEQVVFQNSVEQ